MTPDRPILVTMLASIAIVLLLLNLSQILTMPRLFHSLHSRHTVHVHHLAAALESPVQVHIMRPMGPLELHVQRPTTPKEQITTDRLGPQTICPPPGGTPKATVYFRSAELTAPDAQEVYGPDVSHFVKKIEVIPPRPKKVGATNVRTYAVTHE